MKTAKALSAALIPLPMLCLLASCTISNTDPHPTTHKLLLRDLLNGPDTPDTPPATSSRVETQPVRPPAVQPAVVQAPVAQPQAQTQAAPVETPPIEQQVSGTVTHVVLIWLKTPGDATVRKLLIDSSKALKGVPGVVDVHAGTMLPSTRPVVDSTYDIGLVFTFANVKAMQDYLANPTHVKLLNEVIKPNADHYKVFDFTNQ